jgi:Domain of Unknown Function (DUF1080)
MKHLYFFALLLTTIAFNSCSKSLHPAANAVGFVPLIKENLADCIAPFGIWSVSNGELTATEDQCIWTIKQYKNFILDLEFKNAEGTNSGVIFHCSDPVNWIPNSVEVQIADDFAEKWATSDPTWQCGAVFGHLAAKKHNVKKAGEWNHYTITVIDKTIKVVLNNKLINEMDMSLWTSGTKNPNGGDIPSWMPTPFAKLKTGGHIGFQGKHAGAPIWFRNMRVKEI